MSQNIHETAIVADGAKLGTNVEIGAYSVVGPEVEIGDGTAIGPHVVIDGVTSIGCNNHIYPYAIIGTDPQDKKYEGGHTRVEIGDSNIIREFVLIKTGTESGGWVTKIGNDNLLMANAHIAHDCVLHDDIVMANNCSLAGHVEVYSHAVLGGMTGVHQFVRIGQNSIVGGGAMVVMDVPPYCMIAGNRARTYGLNTVGLERGGFSEPDIAALKAAYRTIFRSKLTFVEACAELAAAVKSNNHVAHFVDFLDNSERGFTR